MIRVAWELWPVYPRLTGASCGESFDSPLRYGVIASCRYLLWLGALPVSSSRVIGERVMSRGVSYQSEGLFRDSKWECGSGGV